VKVGAVKIRTLEVGGVQVGPWQAGRGKGSQTKVGAAEVSPPPGRGAKRRDARVPAGAQLDADSG
jgi:hypothetical protein